MRLPLNSTSDRSVSERVRQDLLALAIRFEPYAVDLDYTFLPQDQIDSLQVDASLGNRTITLPAPVGYRRRRVVKTDSSSNTVTVVGTINGATDFTLATQYAGIEVEPTGAAWLITEQFFGGAQAYVTGTWTPTITLGGGATGLTYTEQTGIYTRIGRIVFYQCRIRLSALGSSTGAVRINGLPLTSVTTFAVTSFIGTNFNAALATLPTGAIDPAGTYIVLYKYTAGAVAVLQDSDCTNTTEFIAAGSYTS